MSGFSFPYRIGRDGRTEVVNPETQVRELMELVLFTSPGERVNRPEFGVGLARQVFSENAPELAVAAEQLIHSGLQRWLSELAEISGISVQARGERLDVNVRFRLLRETKPRAVTVSGKL